MTNGTGNQQSALTTLRRDVEDQIERARSLIEPALPKHCDFRQLVAKTLVAIQSTPSLIDCNPVSIFWCFVHAAELGLSLDVSSQEAHIIPFDNKKQGTGKRAKLITGYRGLIKLAMQHPKVLSVRARAVREKDEFDYDEGSNPFVVHKKYLKGPPGEVVAAYTVIDLVGGGKLVDVMPRFDIDKIRTMSRGSSDPDSPWVKWFDEMAAKTSLRRALKQSPRSIEAEKALALEDAAEAGVLEPGEDAIVVRKPQQPQQSRTSKMRNRVATQQPAEPEPSEPESSERAPFDD